MSPRLQRLLHPKARARQAAEQRYVEIVQVAREFLDGFDATQRRARAPDMG